MTRFAITILVACSSVATAAGDGHRTASGGQWTIVATYAIPEGASGLAYDGSFLYCGIYGADGDQVYQIDPATGNYTLHFNGPQDDAFGLTMDGADFWTTDHPGSSSIPAVAMKVDSGGALLTQFDLPDHYMSGIAFDSGDFWVARYYPDPGHIYKLDASGMILDQFSAPDDQPWDLTMENGNLWMADYWGDTLYNIDPSSGAVLDSHPSEGVDPAGVVWDGQFLWYCDNGLDFSNDLLYKVDLAGSGTPQINIPLSSHDFGTITLGDSSMWMFTVENMGDVDLSLSGMTFGGEDDLSSPDVFPVVIPSLDSAQLTVAYAPDEFAALDAAATVVSNDPINPIQQITLTGHGIYSGPVIAVLEDTHNFGSVRVDATTRWFMSISNQGSEPLNIDDILIDDAHFYLDDSVSLPLSIDTLGSIAVGVWFNPDSESSFGATMAIDSNDPVVDPANVAMSGTGVCAPYPAGDMLWSYLIDTDFDNSVKAILAMPDINGDGVSDVLACSEDDFIRCYNGNAHGTGDVLWEHEIFAGSVYSQNGLQLTEDLNGDDHPEVVVGSAWGGKLIRTLSGSNGQELWTRTTDEYGDGGWVYQVDCSFDFNNDDIVDVLASTGDDSQDVGPKRVYCLDALTGDSIWETPIGGPVFAVIGVEDFTGDGQPDALAGASNASETQGLAVGIDGADGSIEWTYLSSSSSVWGLQQIDDITDDGIADVIIGDFSGNIYGLDATDGGQVFSNGGFGLITRMERLDDVTGDGHPDIIPAHLGSTARVIDGQTGAHVWSVGLVDKPAAVARIDDITGDGINDLVIGTLFSNNFAYFVDGVDGETIELINYGSAVDAIGVIPDVVGDGSWEMVVGGRNGLLTTLSGGTSVFVYGDVVVNGQVDLDDVLCVVDGVAAVFNCPFDDLDMFPCDTGDAAVNVDDVNAVLDAYIGIPPCSGFTCH